MKKETRQALIGFGTALLVVAWLALASVLSSMGTTSRRQEVVEVIPPVLDIHPAVLVAVWIAPPVLAGAGMLIAAIRSSRRRP